jgi:hypothetical protein
MVRIISWNILLRKHEKKYQPKSIILKTYPNEKLRIQNIIYLLDSLITNQTIACLQEVSILTIALLLKKFEKTHNIFYYNIKKDEFLVTITPPQFYILKKFKNKTSNGYLIVSNNIINIINCHLIPQKYTKQKVLPYISNLGNHKPTFISGDFNEIHKNIKNKLKNWICPHYKKTYKKKSLDHIIFNKPIKHYKINNINSKNLSDHNLIYLDF